MLVLSKLCFVINLILLSGFVESLSLSSVSEILPSIDVERIISGATATVKNLWLSYI